MVYSYYTNKLIIIVAINNYAIFIISLVSEIPLKIDCQESLCLLCSLVSVTQVLLNINSNLIINKMFLEISFPFISIFL